MVVVTLRAATLSTKALLTSAVTQSPWGLVPGSMAFWISLTSTSRCSQPVTTAAVLPLS